MNLNEIFQVIFEHSLDSTDQLYEIIARFKNIFEGRIGCVPLFNACFLVRNGEAPFTFLHRKK